MCLVASAIGWTPLWVVLFTTLSADFIFIAYEALEGWRIKDWAFRDVFGYFASRLGVAVIAVWTWGIW